MGDEVNDYHRKLAEICAAGELDLTRDECSFNEQDIDGAAAALAAEDVVDPAVLLAEVERQRHLLRVVATTIAGYYEVCRNEHSDTSAIDNRRRMVFAVGSDIKAMLA